MISPLFFFFKMKKKNHIFSGFWLTEAGYLPQRKVLQYKQIYFSSVKYINHIHGRVARPSMVNGYIICLLYDKRYTDKTCAAVFRLGP